MTPRERREIVQHLADILQGKRPKSRRAMSDSDCFAFECQLIYDDDPEFRALLLTACRRYLSKIAAHSDITFGNAEH